MDDDAAPDEQPAQPAAPFTLEDGAYAVIVSEYLGLRRAGADPLGAALITAAHVAFMGMANAAVQQSGGEAQ